jgi:AcrR family transcriptional regulator
MAALIDQRRRARAKAASADRQRRILEVARDMLRTHPVADVSLETVCNRAQVKAGLGSMYFGDRDQLVLRIVRDETDAWLDRVLEILEASESDGDHDALVRQLTDDLAGRELLARLLAQAWTLLEGRIDTSEAMAFVRRQADRAAEVGERLESSFPALEAGDGEKVILRLQQQMAAWVQGALPRGPLEVALGMPELEAARCDLDSEIRAFLEHRLRCPE